MDEIEEEIARLMHEDDERDDEEAILMILTVLDEDTYE